MFALAAVIVFAAAIFLAVWSLAPDPGWVDPAPRRGFIAHRREELMASSPVYRLVGTLIYIPAYQCGRLPFRGFRAQLTVALARAGHPGGWTPDEFMALSGLVGMGFSLVSGAFAMVWLEGSSAVLMGVAFTLGTATPFFWLEDRGVRRLTHVNRHLPFALDLLSLALGAGLDFVGALAQVVERDTAPGPLVEELHYTLQEMRLGVTRKQALLNLRERVQSEYLNMVVAAIIQAEQMGTPLSQVLRIQAQASRLKRTQRAERVAAESGVKILFPLMTILVAVFLTLFGPVMIRYANGDLF